MTEIAKKLLPTVNEIIADKGEVDLFALVLGEEAANGWDLVLSAPWATPDKAAAIHYIADKLKSYLKTSERTQISRVVIVEHVPAALSKHFNGDEIGVSEHGGFLWGNIPVSRALVLALKRPRVRKAKRVVA